MTVIRLRTETIKWREIDGEVVAIDVAKSAYLSSNSAGAILWQMLSTGATRDELAAKLVDSFEIDRTRAVTDVDAFLADLVARDLLEP